MQVELTGSATDYLLLHPDARPLLPANDSQPDFAALLALLRHAIAAYEVKTTQNLAIKGGKTIVMPCIARCSYDVRTMQQFKGISCLLTHRQGQVLQTPGSWLSAMLNAEKQLCHDTC